MTDIYFLDEEGEATKVVELQIRELADEPYFWIFMVLENGDGVSIGYDSLKPQFWNAKLTLTEVVGK